MFGSHPTSRLLACLGTVLLLLVVASLLAPLPASAGG